MVITISRETGSGGHTVGEMLAKALRYGFYYREIISEVAETMGVNPTLISENGESMSDQTFLDLSSGFIPFSRKARIPFEEIKEAQDELIRKIAAKDDCVIVGRCADFILKDRKDAFHIFIHAGMPYRVERVQRHEGVTGQEERIRREMEVKDRSRAMYYRYFTGRSWGVVGNYNLAVDTGVFTKEQTVELILAALGKVQEGRNHA